MLCPTASGHVLTFLFPTHPSNLPERDGEIRETANQTFSLNTFPKTSVDKSINSQGTNHETKVNTPHSRREGHFMWSAKNLIYDHLSPCSKYFCYCKCWEKNSSHIKCLGFLVVLGCIFSRRRRWLADSLPMFSVKNLSPQPPGIWIVGQLLFNTIAMMFWNSKAWFHFPMVFFLTLSFWAGCHHHWWSGVVLQLLFALLRSTENVQQRLRLSDSRAWKWTFVFWLVWGSETKHWLNLDLVVKDASLRLFCCLRSWEKSDTTKLPLLF